MLFHSPLLLHKNLQQHKPQAVVQALKAGQRRDEIYKTDHTGLTPLHIAAQEGMIEALLWLVYARANIDHAKTISSANRVFSPAYATPLYLAMQQRQWLATQILLCLGADKTRCLALADHYHDDAAYSAIQALRIETRVFRGLLHWAVHHYQPIYGTVLLQLLHDRIHSDHAIDITQENDEKTSLAHQPLLANATSSSPSLQVSLADLRNDLCGLAELAMRNQAPLELVNYLIEMNQGYARQDPAVATLGFWEAIRQTPLSNINRSDAWMALSLQQLKHAEAETAFQLYVQKATPRQKRLLQPLDQPPSSSPQLTQLYHALTFNKKDDFTRLATDFDIDGRLSLALSSVLTQVLHQQNFIGLALFIEHFRLERLLDHAIETSNDALLWILMFIGDQYPYELIHKLPNEHSPRLAEVLTQLPNEEQHGLLSRLISRGMVNPLKDDRPWLEVQQQKAFFQAINIDEATFLSYYLKRLSPHTRDYVQPSPQVHQDFHSNCTQAREQGVLRFGITLTTPPPSLNGLNDRNRLLKLMTDTALGPSQVVLDYLSPKSQSVFFACSKKSYRFRSNQYIAQIDRFLAHLDHEIAHQSYFRNRFHNPFKPSLIIFPVVFGVFTAALALVIHDTNAAYGAIDETIAQHPNCFSDEGGCVVNGRTSNTSHSLPEDCQEICNNISESEWRALMYSWLQALTSTAYGFTAIGCLIGIFYILKDLYPDHKKGLERFDTAPLTGFSAALQHQASQLFNELRIYHSDLQPLDFTTASSVQDVRAALTNFRLRCQSSDPALNLLNLSSQGSAISAPEETEAKTSALSP